MTDNRRRPAKHPRRDHDERSLIERAESTPAGAQEMAAARLAVNIEALLERALGQSGMTQAELAHALGVSEGRVSQIVNGDGNLRIATIGKVFRALGFQPRLELDRVDERRSAAGVGGTTPSLDRWEPITELCGQPAVDPIAGTSHYLAAVLPIIEGTVGTFSCLTEPSGMKPWTAADTDDWSTIVPERKRALA